MASIDSPAVGSRHPLADAASKRFELFARQAAANEAKGALTDTTVAALRDGGFLGLLMPRCFGGAEASPTDALDVVETLCQADASTGWVLMTAQIAMASAAAFLAPDAAAAVFGKGLPIVAGQGAPNGRAVATEGGYRLSGKWTYGSGLLHADYVHTGAFVYDGDKQRLLPGSNFSEVRIFILPRAQARLLGNWDVLGLRATGSVDYAIDDAFVPDGYTHRLVENRPRQGGDLYRIGILGLGAIGHTGFALGAGRRILDEIAALVRGESGRPSILAAQGGGESFHEHYGQAEAKLRAARAFAYEVLGDLQASLQRGASPSTRQTTLVRLALNHATSMAVEIAQFAHRYGGGISLRAGALQRCYRDIMTGAQHVAASPFVLRECAKDLLGIVPGKVWGPRGLGEPWSMEGR